MERQSSCVVFLVSVFILSIGGHGGVLDNRIATIHVINSMPRESEPIELRCSLRYKDHGTKQLRVGDDYQIGVQTKALHFCEASSGKKIASWHAFQPRRDGNHKVILWRVKEDGFFLSWDNSTWVKRYEWETE